jgi:hypothetical protein
MGSMTYRRKAGRTGRIFKKKPDRQRNEMRRVGRGVWKGLVENRGQMMEVQIKMEKRLLLAVTGP